MKKYNLIITLTFLILILSIVIFIIVKNINNNKIFTETITLEGMDEMIKTKNYKSKIGYTLKYDIDKFNITNKNSI